MKGNLDNNKKTDQGSGQNAPSVYADTEIVQISSPDDLRAELFPGIPNDIAWQLIAPKLSGTDINTLSLVSPGWHAAVHGRMVYDARINSHLTENFAVVLYGKKHGDKIRLYPLNGNSAYELPPLPWYFSIFMRYKCVALDGKIYVLGGAIPGPRPLSGSRTMFMLDVAGHKQWKQCSSMRQWRHSFGVGVLDGKIYVVGGLNNGHCVYKCEVYDPKVDSWSSIADLIPCRVCDRVGVIGGELFVYGGMEWTEDLLRQPSSSRNVAVYNSVQNEWRQLGHFHDQGDGLANPWDNAFLAQETLYTMTQDGISVYDMDTNSWTHLHVFPRKSNFNGFNTWALDDEIVTERYKKIDLGSQNPFVGVSVVRSRGFNNKKMQIAFPIVFKKMGNIHLRHDLKHLIRQLDYDLCLIQL